MKKLNTIKSIFALLTLTFTIAACKNDFDSDPIEAAGIGFVHASPGTAALDFVVDNQKVTSFTYTKDLGYYAAYPGTRLIGIAKKDSLKYLATTNTVLAPGKFYSFFVVDTLKKTTLLTVEDDLSAPETDKAKVRFINLSPGSNPLALNISGQAALFSAKAFKEFTTFSSIATSDNYTFEVKENGSQAVAASLPNVKIEKGKIYTIWAKGLKTATDSTKFSIGILTNK